LRRDFILALAGGVGDLSMIACGVWRVEIIWHRLYGMPVVVGGGIQMNWNKWFRQTHRWVSILFTVDVIINGVMVAEKKYSNTMGLSAVGILAVLLITGLYLFVLPYFTKWRS
jgi:hypothetical protein